MAIISTGAIYKSLVFDGESSRDYGIYITGQAVYNAPERDVEMINIPGRNGSFALDKGRFQNIEVTYPAGIFADNEADFAQGISDFRNFLCSRNGYVRLTDDYNPDEYRMAVYKSGLEVTPAQLKAGEFQIVFDCKPQRFLTSGEEPITIGEWHETETASGEIASFEAEAGDAVKSLVADIEPIQSLNGYDKPWSGGNGKNKFYINEQTLGGITVSVNADGSFKLNGTTTNAVGLRSDIYALGSGAYLLSATSSSSSGYYVRVRNADTSTLVASINADGGVGVAVAGGINVYFEITVLENTTLSNVSVYPQLELSASKTSFEPYSNICPISGHDEVNVSVCGKNLLPPWTSLTLSGVTFDIASDGSIIANGENQTGYNEAIGTKAITLPSGTYTVSGGGSLPIRVEVFNVTKNETYWEGGTKTFTYNGTDFLEAWIYVKKNVAMDNVILRPQIEPGSSVSAYEPYQSYATYTTDLSGTRYGGTLDVASGVLTVTKGILTENEFTYFDEGTSAGGLHWVEATASVNLNADTIASMLEAVPSGDGWSSTVDCIEARGGKFRLYTSETSLADFKTKYSELQVVYELTTPTTVQLTAQEVELLVGLNQVWANSGDVSVEYGTAPNVVINPTLFESSPMLEVEGYGSIGFNGYEIVLGDGAMGEIVIAPAGIGPCNYARVNYARFDLGTVPINSFNPTDTFTIEPSTFKFNTVYGEQVGDLTVVSNSLSGASTSVVKAGSLSFNLTFNMPQISFTVGQESSSEVKNTVTVNAPGGNTTTIDVVITYYADGRIVAVINISTDHLISYPTTSDCSRAMGKISGYSTISLIGHPTYIDCDLGEAYKYEDDVPVSLNQYIDLGSDLPKLGEGVNTITYDDTVTDLKAIPRWWKI